MRLYRDPRSSYWYYDLPELGGTEGRKRRSTRRTRKVEAMAVAQAELKRRLDKIQLGPVEEITLDEALARYLASTTRKRDHANIASRINKLLGRLQKGAGRFSLDPAMSTHDLTLRHVRRLREAREAEGNAVQTINHEVKTLAAALNYVKGEGVRVPATTTFPQPKVPGKLRWFTREEAARLLAELDPRRTFVGAKGRMRGVVIRLNATAQRQRQDAYDLAVFLLDTGCRYGEVGGIPWSAIDTVGWRWVDIYRSKTGNSSMLTMTGRLRAVLQRRYEVRGNSAYVFPGYADNGKDAPRGTSTKAIRRAIERAKLNTPELVERYGRATTHTLRDTFASWLVQAGVSLYKVQQLLGHTDPRMTQKYAKLEPRGVSDEAAAVLDRIAEN